MNRFTFRLPVPLWRPDEPAGGGGGGGGGADTVAAGGGADTVAAGGGADTVAAGGGADTVEGGAASARVAAPANALTKEGGADGKGAGDWPDDWRERAIKAAGADEKVIERLKRMDSPGALLKSFLEADKRINSGKPAADEPMPDPAKDADGAKSWRAARGIPAEASGYTLPDDLTKVLIDEDKPVLAAFYADAHKAGIPQQFVAPMVGWYLGMQEAQATERNANDKVHADQVEETLRAEWGSDFKPNRTIAKTYADEVVPGLFNARLPDGRMVGNTPEFVRGLAQLGRLHYGDVSFAGGEQATASENRMAELKKIMDTDIDKWNASPDLRSEYGKLLEASSKRPGRA